MRSAPVGRQLLRVVGRVHFNTSAQHSDYDFHNPDTVAEPVAHPYWQPWETWGAPLHTFSWNLKHNSMSATAVTAAAGNFLQTRFSGFGGHSRPRPHKHSPEHGLGLCEHHQNNFQKCFFFCVCHGKTPGLCHGNSWENEISYKITYKIYWECYLRGFWHFCAKPSSLGNGQKHCKNPCFCPTKTTKTIPQWLEDDLQIFSDSCAIHLRGFNPAESLSLIKMNWCYNPNQHICQRRCPDFIPYWDKLILLPQSTYVPERLPGVYPFLR